MAECIALDAIRMRHERETIDSRRFRLFAARIVFVSLPPLRIFHQREADEEQTR
jgi:hypothetical protein